MPKFPKLYDVKFSIHVNLTKITKYTIVKAAVQTNIKIIIIITINLASTFIK